MEERICSKCNHKQKIRTKLKKFTCSSCGTNNFMRNTINNSAPNSDINANREAEAKPSAETEGGENISVVKKEERRKVILD